MDFTGTRVRAHEAYVGISRVTCLKNLQMVGFSASQIKVNPKVTQEMKRLRSVGGFGDVC